MSVETTFNFSPSVASKITGRYAGHSIWRINLRELIAEIIEAGTDDAKPAVVELRPNQDLAEIASIYLSALIAGNSSDNLVDLGQKIIWNYAANHNTQCLIDLTNYIFKQMTLSPPSAGLEEGLYRQWAAVNFELHTMANIVIHSILRCNPEYREFSREIDQLISKIDETVLPKRLCFVFLTENYLENFDLWIKIFNSSTKGQEHLIILNIGAGVHEQVCRKLSEIGFINATLLEINPTQTLTPSGNGQDLYHLWYLKIRMIQHFVSVGHDVIYSDPDAFWLKNFVHIWQKPPLLDVDIAFMPSTDMPLYAVQQWGAIPCCGFFACRSSENLQRFLGVWERWVEVMFDDQIGLAQMLLDAGVEWEEHRHVADWRKAVWDRHSLQAEHIRLSILDPTIARRVGTPDLSTAEGVVIWHPRWITSKGKFAQIAAPLVALAGANADDLQPRQLETLTGLANRYRSDKGTATGPAHHYTFLYDLLFSDARDQPVNFLEIGLAVGGPELGNSAERFVISPSVQMWLSYFSRANIFGFDITDFTHMQGPRFKFTRGDCGRAEDLQKILQMSPHFDIIIDDASHASFHQQQTFKELFPSLRPGGLYIIEDLHWQSPFFEDALPKVPKTWNFFHEFFDNEKYVVNQLISEEFMEAVRRDTYSFFYFRDFTGQTTIPKVIVIKKKGNPVWVKGCQEELGRAGS